MTKGRLAKVKFQVLGRRAHVLDVDPTLDYMKSGNSLTEAAFQVAGYAFDLIIHLSHAAFPALDKRTRKKGGKWLRENIVFYAEDAVQMLVNAIPALMADLDGRLSDDQAAHTIVGAEPHRRLENAAKSFYPVKERFLEECRAEFSVMQTHEPREAVAEGEHVANEYSQALLRGENPDDDPGLVALQRLYARDYFMDRATFGAMRNALSVLDARILQDDLVRFPAVKDAKAADEMRQRVVAAWIEGLGPYLEYIALESKSVQSETAQSAKLP